MDSGNNSSASTPSSSGGDDEYDSRADISYSSFLNPCSSSHAGPISNPPSLHHHQLKMTHHLHHHPHRSPSTVFDPLSNLFDPLTRSPSLASPNPLLNLDMAWHKDPRPDPSSNGAELSVSSTQLTPSLSYNQGQSRGAAPASHAPVQFSRLPITSSAPAPAPTDQAPVAAGAPDHINNTNGNNVVRNPKKRSRASRRAPTTVLTTDPTNFRAMVQEFTGIPSPPFTASPFQRSRLDLFGNATSALRSAHLDTSSAPPYLLRPFAQRFQHPFASSTSLSSSASSSAFLSSSMIEAMASASSCSATNNISSGSVSNTGTTNSTSMANLQLPASPLGLLKQPQNLLNVSMQNPVLDFGNSLIQGSIKYSNLAPSSIFSSKIPPGPTSEDLASHDHSSHLRMSVLEDFGLSQGPQTGVANIHSSSERALTRNNIGATNWGDGVGSNDGDQGGLLGSLGGSYGNPQRSTNGRVSNYSASSSDFHGDRGPENMNARSEGMVESWICSSD